MDRRCRTSLARFSLAAALALIGIPSPAQVDRETWALPLADQIFDDEQCVVAFLSELVEREVDGRNVVIAKVHCEDDRVFGVYRSGSLGRFTITECERPDQETC